MTRAFFAIGFALFVAFATGETPLLEVVACVDACGDDDETGHCAPGCDDCSCCARAPSLPTPTVAKPRPLMVDARLPEFLQLVPPSPEPHEILHVPIA